MCVSSAFDALALTNRDLRSNLICEPGRSAERCGPPGLPARGHRHDILPPRTSVAAANPQEVVNRSQALPLCPSVAWPS
jgi:hypothetical protein